ncbi:MAG: hypothetical protein H6908_06475 [Hyphomicrobiales bacterium]|nr:hypothetical protein [Hyphomicrobiales bacterium]
MYLDDVTTRRLMEACLAMEIELRLTRLEMLAAKAGFDPNQPRILAGQPGGGQWTKLPYAAFEDVLEPIPEDIPLADEEDIQLLEDMISLLPVGRLLRAWKLLRGLRAGWRLGRHKSAQKWRNRIVKRNWTPEEIEETITKGEKFPARNNITGKETATRYEYNGRYVVVDDITKEILQISGENYKR